MQLQTRIRKEKDQQVDSPQPGTTAQEYRIINLYPPTLPCTTCEEDGEMVRHYGTRIYTCYHCGAQESR